MRATPLIAALLVVFGCGGQSAASPTASLTSPVPTGPSSHAGATAVVPTPALTPSPTASAAPSPTATHNTPTTPVPTDAVTVRDGEPWIVYEGPVPGTDWVGNIVIRPDGTDNHWATPGAPIGTGTTPPQQGGDGWQLHPDWSPDGQQLAFVVDVYPSPNGGHRDIWISNADGTNARQLFDCTAPCDTSEFPAWSKDGKSVLFARWDLVGGVVDGSVLQVADVATGAVSTIAATHGAEYFAYPRWSRDGKSIVTQIDLWSDTGAQSVQTGAQVAVVDLTTTPAKITKITPLSLGGQYPDWSPADDLIVFQASPLNPQVGESDLYTIHPDGSHVSVLLDDTQNDSQPSWLPDASGVIFTRQSTTDIGSATMATVLADGTGFASATSDHPRFGTHPRLRPTP